MEDSFVGLRYYIEENTNVEIEVKICIPFRLVDFYEQRTRYMDEKNSQEKTIVSLYGGDVRIALVVSFDEFHKRYQKWKVQVENQSVFNALRN